MDTERFYMPVVVTRPIGCPHSYIRADIDFSTLYTSIPQKLLNSRIAALVHSSFKKKDGSTRYTHVKVGQRKGYFINSINGSGKKCIQQIRYAI